MLKATEIFVDEGRFSYAAKLQKETAALYEAEMDFEKASKHYRLAADYYEGENAQSASHQCLLKVAHYCAEQEDYGPAIEIFEKVAVASLNHKLLKWGVKDNLFKAVLCLLAAEDVVGAKKALERYKDMDTTFQAQRECIVLEAILAACEAYDAEAFTTALQDYDRITPLDGWKTTILLRIKNSIKPTSHNSLK